jgi:membrane associated rhomboid family serine protease
MDISKSLNLRENARKSYGQDYTTSENITNFLKVVFKLGIIFIILTLNFLGLSVALNCNANSSFGVKLGAAIFGFFFGFIYLMLNYYTYRVLTLRKVCRMNPDRLFPI